jgi:hypothetical protein
MNHVPPKRSHFVPRVDLAERSTAEPNFWFICAKRDDRTWQRVMTRPGEHHLGERVSLAVAHAIRGTKPHGYPWIRWCQRCGRRFIASRVYQARVFKVDWGTVLGTERVRKRLFAMRCAPCKAKTAARQRARATSTYTNRARTAKRAAARANRQCAQCGGALEGQRLTRRFCSARCRLASWRNGNGIGVTRHPSSAAVTAGPP